VKNDTFCKLLLFNLRIFQNFLNLQLSHTFMVLPNQGNNKRDGFGWNVLGGGGEICVELGEITAFGTLYHAVVNVAVPQLGVV